jgi:D-serine deaminase-like pyridoxal phosphate-dependent protein
VRLSEEHAWVTLVDDNRLELGQLVRIVPNHVCVAVNLFDELQVARGGRIETTWAVAARGRSQ